MVSVTARHTLGHFDREGPDIAFTDIAYRLGGALVNYDLTLLTNQERHHFLFNKTFSLCWGGERRIKKLLKYVTNYHFFAPGEGVWLWLP